MRDYLSTANLRHALAMGSVATAMALPRIVRAGDGVGILIAAALVSMTLTAGAVTAWGTQAGMRGPYRRAGETAAGLAVALALALLLVPVQRGIVQPLFEAAVRDSGDVRWVALQLPETVADRAALALWAAGFQTLFGVAAPTCLAARITRRVWPALILTTALAAFVASLQLDAYGAGMGRGFLSALSAGRALLGCLLYVRFGLLPCAAFAAGSSLHLLWDIV